MESVTIARTAVVHGLVQGVGFRWAAQTAATQLGITGWVRNESDGSVGCLIQGPPDRVKQMIAWLETGPRYAQVSWVDVAHAEVGRFSTFDIRG